jgi:hypothetical protein
MKHIKTSCVWNTTNSADRQALSYLLTVKLWQYLLKFDVIVDRRNISFVDCVKNLETYYGQLPVITDEVLQSQTLVTRPITNVHVEDT